MDDYGNKFLSGSHVIHGHYLELFPRQNRMYYLDDSKHVIVLTGCVVSIVKDITETMEKVVKGKLRKCFVITERQHDIFLDLLLESN